MKIEKEETWYILNLLRFSLSSIEIVAESEVSLWPKTPTDLFPKQFRKYTENYECYPTWEMAKEKIKTLCNMHIQSSKSQISWMTKQLEIAEKLTPGRHPARSFHPARP